MNSETLIDRVASLVDLLRADRNVAVSLTEVASVTEVLISVMERYFHTLDASLYREFRTISTYIQSAKVEISKLRPDELKEQRLPRAGKQLDAVVKATEEATQSIMDAAEEMMGADRSDSEAYAATVNAASMRIIEACAFQDITGQRISKVVETLNFIEGRIEEIEKTWGDVAGGVPAPADEPAPDDDRALLSGPQLDGEGIDQDAIDALLEGAGMPAPQAVPEKSSQAAIDAMFD